MTGRLLSLVMALAFFAALRACGALVAKDASSLGGGTPGAGGAGTDAPALPTVLVEQVTPDPSGGSSFHEGQTSMRVLWTISGYVFGKDFSGDKGAAQAMLFKPLDITDTAIIFDGQACEGVTFQKETVNAAEYLSSVWHATPQGLGIDVQEFQAFKTNCSLPGFEEYVRLNDGRLIVQIDSVFYFFEPKRNY